MKNTIKENGYKITIIKKDHNKWMEDQRAYLGRQITDQEGEIPIIYGSEKMERNRGQEFGNNSGTDEEEPEAAGLVVEQGSGDTESEGQSKLMYRKANYSFRDRTIRESYGLLDGRLKKSKSI